MMPNGVIENRNSNPNDDKMDEFGRIGKSMIGKMGKIGNIEINYINNELILIGHVSSYYQKQMAQETAKKIIKDNNLMLNIKNDIIVQ